MKNIARFAVTTTAAPKLIGALMLMLIAALALPSQSSAAVAFSVSGVVTQASSVLYYNSQGLPSVMTFTILDEDYQAQTIVCRRPYLATCTCVDSSTLDKKVHVTGILEMFSRSSNWQLSAQSTSLVYTPAP